jgi:hypothetical protein
MAISTKERELRIKAIQSALASVRMEGYEPSELAQRLFASWSEGTTSLDATRNALLERLRRQDD